MLYRVGTIKGDFVKFEFLRSKSAVKTNNEYLAKKVNVEVIDKYNGEALVKESSNIKKDVMIIVKGAKGIVDKDIVRIN